VGNLLYWLPIHNSDFVRRFVDRALELRFNLDLNSLRLLRFLTDKIPDATIKDSLIKTFNALIVFSNEWNPDNGLRGFPGSSASDLIKVADDGITEMQTQDSSLGLYRALLGKGYGIELAIKSAEQLASLKDEWKKRVTGLKLYEVLVETGHAFELAIKAAEIGLDFGIESYRWQVAKAALELYRVLVEKGQAFELAIKAAEKAMRDGLVLIDEFVGLYKALVDKNQAFEPAIKAAEIYMKNYAQYEFDLVPALELYKSLVKKGQGFDPARKAVEEAILVDDPATQNSAALLDEELKKYKK
jgi:hypothetical protein